MRSLLKLIPLGYSWKEKDSSEQAKFGGNDQEALKEFKLALEDEGYVEDKDDRFLMAILIVKKFVRDKCIKCYKKHKTEFAKHDDLLSVPYNEWSQFIQDRVVLISKDRDSLGRRVIIGKVARWDTSKINVTQLFGGVYYMITELCMEPETAQNGIFIILDFEGVGFTQMVNILRMVPLKIVYGLINAYQGALPLKMTGLHAIHTPDALVKFYNIFKHLIRAKLQKRLVPHSGDLSAIGDAVTLTNVPECIGGDVAFEDCQDFEFVQKLEKMYGSVSRKRRDSGYVGLA